MAAAAQTVTSGSHRLAWIDAAKGASTGLEGATRTLRFTAGTGFGLALAVALSCAGAAGRICGYCGIQSLAIYLGHQVLLALGFLALAAAGAAGWPMLLALSALAAAGSLALHSGAGKLRLGWIYAPPAALTERLAPRPGGTAGARTRSQAEPAE